jgi:hypothetical protein
MRESWIYPCNRSDCMVSQRLIESEDFLLDSQTDHACSQQPAARGSRLAGTFDQPAPARAYDCTITITAVPVPRYRTLRVPGTRQPQQPQQQASVAGHNMGHNSTQRTAAACSTCATCTTYYILVPSGSTRTRTKGNSY